MSATVRSLVRELQLYLDGLIAQSEAHIRLLQALPGHPPDEVVATLSTEPQLWRSFVASLRELQPDTWFFSSGGHRESLAPEAWEAAQRLLAYLDSPRA